MYMHSVKYDITEASILFLINYTSIKIYFIKIIRSQDLKF